MAFSAVSALLEMTVHRNDSDAIPDHHITVKAAEPWFPYLTSWYTSQTATQPGLIRSLSSSRNSSRESISKGRESPKQSVQRTGFKNPWPSWYKPNRKQVWDSLEWGEDQDPCIQLAVSHASNVDDVAVVAQGERLKRTGSAKLQRTRTELTAQLLKVQKPDFSFDSSLGKVKTTWLGHAGILVQLPALKEGNRPIRCIFDPMFSNRSSPSQYAGPIRSYPPPCKTEDLPPIDVFMISHNHHDHLDYDTVMTIWKSNKDTLRFVVPLGNRQWFVDCGVDADRVIELDWWESIELNQSESNSLKITCTPNQHNSGRTGMDANAALWSSWYVEYPEPNPCKIYFAGDTGYQFHESLAWPPTPAIINGKVNTSKREYKEDNPYPSCPAFEEIAQKLGSPDLLLLPVAVGATFSFLRSQIPLPDASSPFPRHKAGMTAANHMPPWDAVHVFRLMTKQNESQQKRAPLAVAMHWGTFVPERTEVLKTLGQLEYACIQQDVQFGRSLDDIQDESAQPVFLALHHGQSITS